MGWAEDAIQDALETAIVSWADGVPERPGAWLSTVARRKAIDRIRRDKNRMRKTEQLGRLEARLAAHNHAGEADGSFVKGRALEGRLMESEIVVRDEQLRLIFGCCHPALSVEAQTALTLKAVCGLTTPEIASAFLLPEATLAQRLVRAKRKIRSAAVPFRIPPDAELLGRVRVVHHVIYLLFNEGYSASGGADLVRHDLCDEAIRLSRLLATLLTDDAESFGLLALMLLTHARRAARVDADGELVMLDVQDRSLWDQAMIADGTAVLDQALRLNSVGPYQLQAAIGALHGAAKTADQTDWEQITSLYGRWMRLAPTPVVELNRLSALSMAAGPGAAFAELQAGKLDVTLANYQPLWALRADLLAKLGDGDGAHAAYLRAAELSGTASERRFFRSRADAVEPT